MEIVSVLTQIEVGGRHTFKGVSRADVDCIKSTVSKFNGDFDRRKVNGEPTTLIAEMIRDEKHECYDVEVCRYAGVLPKEGGRFVLPVHPLAD